VTTFVLILAVFAAGGAEATVDFDNDVMPVFTKAGCNTGACHGAAVGRGGFKLSLYGGDPAADFASIVHELEGRRVNLAQADESLILLKPTEAINHEGGYRLEYDGAGAERLLQWIEQGTLRNESRRLEQFHVSPSSHVVDRVGTSLQLKATARFSDGTTVDVTQWTVFAPEDAAAVEIDAETAVAKLLRKGRHIIVARYLDQVVPLEIIVPLLDSPPESLANQPRHNFIDERVLERLAVLRLPVATKADNATFLRRATLDLTGRLPTIEATRKLLNDHDPAWRKLLIDQLIGSEEFNEYWTFRLAQLLRIRSQPQDTQGALVYHQWLERQIATGVPYDQLAREIILASGDSHQIGPANFYRTVAGAREQAEFTSELFMGSRLRCANCHNHPLDHWTQDDYHGLAAIFAKVEAGRIIKLNRRGEVSHPRTGEAAVARIPGGPFLDAQLDERAALATWLTDRDNPYFAKAIVNRLWKSMMGRGLVEPTDDLRVTNPATHPALLKQLAEDFVAHDYDLRHTLRRIAVSSAYGRSSQTTADNLTDDRYYSHALTRPMRPEVLADAMSDVLGIAETYGDQPVGTRAIALFDSKISSPSLDILGRCSREESCEVSDLSTGGLTRKLHLFNGPLLNARISQSQGHLAQLIGAKKSPTKIIDELYLRALSRSPWPKEREFWHRQLASAKDLQQQNEILEDFLWSLLTCREFATNH